MASPLEVSTPTIDKFAEVLSQEAEWYTLGVFLGATTQELDAIGLNYRTVSVMRCLIELYTSLQRRGKCLSWDHIANTLRRMKNYYLADQIISVYILLQPTPPDRPSPVVVSPVVYDCCIEDDIVKEIVGEFVALSKKFTLLTTKIKNTFKNSNTDIGELQDLIEGFCGLEPLPQDQATIDDVFERLKQHYSLLNFEVLIFLVENLISSDDLLQKDMENFKVTVDGFKFSVKIGQLAHLIKEKQIITGSHKIMKLKVREFWSQCTMKQFELVMNTILDTLYDRVSQVSVGTGCICVSWVVPDINTLKLIPELPLELVKIIGIISLHIGDDVIYNIEGEGCEVIEAAMLQAIELKNTQAIELLLAMGCDPEVATYNGDNAVTTIVNIREKSSDESGLDYVCVLGHDQHVEAIAKPTIISKPECSSCLLKEKMMKQLYKENASLLSLKQRGKDNNSHYNYVNIACRVYNWLHELCT